MQAAWVATFALAAAACGDNTPWCEATPAQAKAAAAPCAAAPCTDLFVAAHQDDGLLFMNPEILGSLRRGDHVIVLYVTAGDLGEAGNDQYWIDRERGALVAYADMAGTPTLDAYVPPPEIPHGWRITGASLGGIAATEYDLTAAPVTLVFLHLGDGQEQCLWEQSAGCAAGRPFVAVTKACPGRGVSPACPNPSSLPVQRVTRDQLVTAIADAITRFDVDSVDALDGTHLHFDRFGLPTKDGWEEYPDHYYSALFTLAAVAAAQPASPRALTLGLHRGYTIVRDVENVAPGVACAKADAFARYALFDQKMVRRPTPKEVPACLDCGVRFPMYRLRSRQSWQRRSYATRTLPPGSGALEVGGTCLGASGAAVVTVPCAGAPTWTATDRGQLALGGDCLTAGAAGPVALAACDPARADQVVLVFDNGQLRTSDAGCLTWDGTQLTDATCLPAIGADGHVTDVAPPAQAFALGAR